LIACRHHERANGSGYPAGIGGAELDTAACLLAAADVFHALGEARPHRPALEPAEAARVLAAFRWTVPRFAPCSTPRGRHRLSCRRCRPA
jgi:HD-GYP domain-containing protein (c-di-GMP phosphodiesterase class II)